MVLDLVSFLKEILESIKNGDVYPMIHLMRVCVESALVFLLMMEAFYFLALVNPAPKLLDFSEVRKSADIRYPVRVRVLLSIVLILLIVHLIEATQPLITSLFHE